MTSVLKRAWIPLVLVVVLAVSGLIVMRLHKVFASQDLNANAGPGIEIEIEIVQFNPELVTYDVFGPAGTTATIDYYDADAKTHEGNTALPWSTTLSTTLPAVEDARRHRRVPDTNLPWVHENTSEDRTNQRIVTQLR